MVLVDGWKLRLKDMLPKRGTALGTGFGAPTVSHIKLRDSAEVAVVKFKFDIILLVDLSTLPS